MSASSVSYACDLVTVFHSQFGYHARTDHHFSNHPIPTMYGIFPSQDITRHIPRLFKCKPLANRISLHQHGISAKHNKAFIIVPPWHNKIDDMIVTSTLKILVYPVHFSILLLVSVFNCNRKESLIFRAIISLLSVIQQICDLLETLRDN